ncbi:MAG TPA: protein kinase [Candidatus Limnocylindrales bacterium]|nr:protein kinase [Candidatus Limnocylindrales bacterium]
MSDVWKRWEGQVVDHKYQLQKYLGSTDHSAVYLAEFHDPQPRKAAVKVISGDVPYAEQQLTEWKCAALITHPNLQQIYATGTCKIGDMELLYVAMEYAEENLGEILPQRALTLEEAREMLKSVTEILLFLHARNLAHGHVKPSNILAVGEQLKLSSDTIQPAGGIREMHRQRSGYDAPEIVSAPYTLASDVWSLGVTLVAALTQQPAVLPYDESADPVVPPSLRAPFFEIARHALRRDPKLRWTTTKIAERLNIPVAAPAKAAAAVASASAVQTPIAAAPPPPPPQVAPASVPISKEPAIPLAKQQPPAPVMRPARPRPTVTAGPKRAILVPNYLVPLFAAILVVAAIIMLPKMLRNRAQPETSTVASSTAPPATNIPKERAATAPSHTEPVAKQATPAKPVGETPSTSVVQERPAQTPNRPVAAPVTSAPAVLRTTETGPTTNTPGETTGRGEVIEQVLPEPTAKALATIHGTVHVGVKVHVDAAGTVSEATLDSPGPSKYFADLSLKAAQRWVFNSPEADGRSQPSDWILHFQFTQTGVRAIPQQVKQ